MASGKKVVVAMSGGVDSSVAAALLVQQGFQVIGMMLRLWSEPGKETENRCCTPDDMAIARNVADRLGIAFYALDARQIFYDEVVRYFLEGYLGGITPNPCLQCNRHVRWGFLFRQALALGADFLATGHYARLRSTPNGGLQLLRGLDVTKDQSYVLHVLNQDQLSRALFPLGELTKPQVRALARQFNLPVAERPESQDLCFVGSADYRDFLLRHAPQALQPGPILTQSGKKLGEHRGLSFYTIGQRKGLGISSPTPLYVLEKDVIRNILIVGTAQELGRANLLAHPANWISGRPPDGPLRAQVMIRYKAHPQPGMVIPEGADKFRVQFDTPLRDITPGQAAVIFDEEICLGGGIISS